MKKTITILSVIALSITMKSIGQPLITALNYTNLGTKMIGYPITGVFAHQSAAANSTWSYGTVANSAAAFYFMDVASSTQSQAVLDAFPTATYFTEVNGMDNTNYQTTISEVNTNGQFTLGFNSASGINVLPTPEHFLKLPLSYQSTFGTRQYDAYGTLTTPFGTYTNVVRIVNETSTKYGFVYYSFDPIIEILMSYDVLKSNQSITAAYFYNMELNTGVNELTKSGFSASPNPSTTGIFTIALKNSEPEYELVVTDVMGKVIFAQKNNVQTSNIDLSKEANGSYFIQLKTKAEIITKKLMINK